MTDFDPTQHPRGNADNDGQFAEKTQSKPEAALTAGTALHLSNLGDVETFSATEVRHDLYGPIRCVDVSLTERADGVDGGPFDLYIEPIADLKLSGLQPRGMSDAQWAQKLDDHYPAVVAFLEKRYDASLDFTDTEDNRWDDIEMHFRVQVPSREITQEEAFDIGWNKTKAVQLYNESDHGTYGTENLGRLLNEAMDAAVVVPGDRFAVMGEAKLRGDRDIDDEVELRVGERELRDVTALAIAQRLSDNDPTLEALHHLGMQGWADRKAVHEELLKVYTAGNYPREKRRANMMFTWLIHGGQND